MAQVAIKLLDVAVWRSVYPAGGSALNDVSEVACFSCAALATVLGNAICELHRMTVKGDKRHYSRTSSHESCLLWGVKSAKDLPPVGR